jgi:L,D-peptidoglycan transpeptidase YkuD (ErfK/YbiS/YcfS/YnhG family)
VRAGARAIAAGAALAVLGTLAPAASATAAPAEARRAGGVPGARRGCPANLADELARTGAASELITVEAAAYATTYATLERWRRSGSCFVAAGGPWPARVGRNGLSDHHREGDGTTPTGAYGIGPVMYGIDPNPGVHYPYHLLVCGDWWDEDPTTPQYNLFVHVPCGKAPPFGGGSEALWTEAPAYDHFAVVEYNSAPIVPGRGSAIFLHVDGGSPTDGCISLAASELGTTLVWLRPADHPTIVIGTAAEIRRF